jgi:hypothetical protein
VLSSCVYISPCSPIRLVWFVHCVKEVYDLPQNRRSQMQQLILSFVVVFTGISVIKAIWEIKLQIKQYAFNMAWNLILFFNS